MLIRCLSKRALLTVGALVAILAPFSACAQTLREGAVSAAAPAAPRFGMVIHGGAGTIARDKLSAEREAEYRAALEQVLQTGYRILAAGGTSLDAIEASVRLLEDSPLFNAGKGAVFTAEGRNELDASIMNGATLSAGAVAGVTRVRNPITLARRVMEASPHVMMAREGADAFAAEQGLELVPAAYFFTEKRWQSLLQELDAAGLPVPARPAGAPREGAGVGADRSHALGTVGAVALDQHGQLAAATSTGGMSMKRFGRIGDSPVIGAGTYADARCAVSATGHGEFFIRNVVAHDICARMTYLGVSLERAAHDVVMVELVRQQAEGGVIALDAHGNHTMPFNTSGMYRGHIDHQGRTTIAIFRD